MRVWKLLKNFTVTIWKESLFFQVKCYIQLRKLTYSFSALHCFFVYALCTTYVVILDGLFRIRAASLHPDLNLKSWFRVLPHELDVVIK